MQQTELALSSGIVKATSLKTRCCHKSGCGTIILHHNDDNQGKNDGPVAVIVTRKARKEKIPEFEELMDGIIHEAMKFEGHRGVNMIRPTDPSNPEYVVIFRFNTYDNLTKWEKSKNGLTRARQYLKESIS